MGKNNNNASPEHNTRPISRRTQLERIINQLSEAELRHFMLETAVQDATLREAILVTFSDLLSSNETEEHRYRERLYKILTQYTNKDGYIGHKNTHGLAAAITALLNTARKATTPTKESVDLCTATISVMPKLGEKMDDSEGYLYQLMQLTCTILLECFDNLKPEAQQACFQRILTTYTEPDYLDLDLDSFLLELLKEWARNNKPRQAACLRQQELMLKASGDDQWRKNYLLQQTNDLLLDWGKS
ncbi:MAG: hypothetical protein ACPGSM_17880 [Thiolinea sp.]